MTSRRDPLGRMERYDVVIIGGGMAGAGVARDLALRGVSVALVEKGDFASATTSPLLQAHPRRAALPRAVRLRARARVAPRARALERLAPHLVRPLPFLVPIYRDSSRSLIKVRIGLKLYDWLTPGRESRALSRAEARSTRSAWSRRLRAEDLLGAGYYFDDLLLFPERLCLENVLSACRHGARAFNYARSRRSRRDAAGTPQRRARA